MADEFLGEVTPLPPGATEGGVDGSNFESLSDAALEAAISGQPLPETETPPATPPEAPAEPGKPQEVPQSTQATPPPAPATPAPVETEVQDNGETDESKRLQIELQKRDAALELQRAHSSRLAGQLGHLKKTIEGLRQPGTESGNGTDLQIPDELSERLNAIESAVTSMSVQNRQSAIMAAISNEAQSIGVNDALSRLTPEESRGIFDRYADDWQAALSSDNEEQARLIGRAVVLNVAADARLLSDEKDRAEARQRVAASTSTLRQKKIAAGAVSMRAAAPTATQPAPARSISELSDKELEELTDRTIAGA